MSLYVLHGFARQGCGSAMPAFLEQGALTRGVDALKVAMSLTSCNFYLSHGYELLGQSRSEGVRCVYGQKRLKG